VITWAAICYTQEVVKVYFDKLKVTVSSDILARKMSEEHEISLVVVGKSTSPWKNNGAYFRGIRIQYNDIIAHIQVKGCCKCEPFEFLQHCTEFGYWKCVAH
jgi:hypothetical protein